MHLRLPPRVVLLVFGTLASGAPAAAQDDVTIYRCTDARGKLSIQDSPCAKGDSQQTRQMVRPKDPPPRLAPVRSGDVAPALSAPPAPQVVVVRTPQPLYECVRPDNTVYTSDSGEGNPRWVSIYDDYPYRRYPIDGGVIGIGGVGLGGIETRETRTTRGIGVTGSATVTRGDAQLSARVRTGGPAPQLPVDRGHPRPPPPTSPPGYPDGGYGYGYGYGYAATTLVRDECHALPQFEVCDRIRDRRDEIRRRFFNAQPSERATLTTEERGINARLSADCGGA